MIKYNLKCHKNHEFESWFSNSQEFEKLNKKDLLECIYCSSKKINTLALSGLKNDNNSIRSAKNSIYVPMKTYGMVECIHQIFLHSILDESMEIFEWDRDDFQDMNINNFNL